MNHKKDLLAAIENGMKKACNDMYSFCDNPAQKFNAEYLFTVATAHAINALNGPPADPYEIRLELNTKIFARDCLPVFPRKKTPLKSHSNIFRKNSTVDITRHGRIDIAVYYDPVQPKTIGRTLLCAIELKGFNPSRSLVVKDLRRNLQFHRGVGPTGPSLLNLSFFAALHSRSAKHTLRNENAVKAQYQKWLSELGLINDLSITIHTFTVSVDPMGRLLDEADEIVIDTSSIHHFVGAVVMFEGPNCDLAL